MLFSLGNQEAFYYSRRIGAFSVIVKSLRTFVASSAPDCSTADGMSGAAGRDAALRLENMSSVGSFTPYNGTHYNVILMLLSL